MKEFECGPEPRLVGMALRVFLEAFGTYRVRGEKVLRRNFGVDKIEFTDQSTYPVQAWLLTLKELQDQFGPEMIARVGAQIPDHVLLPPDWNSMEAAFEGLEMAYKMNHISKNPEQLGFFTWVRESERSGHWYTNNPYPCALDMGLIRAFVNKFPNQYGTTPTLVHGEGECRHKGGDSCIYRLTW